MMALSMVAPLLPFVFVLVEAAVRVDVKALRHASSSGLDHAIQLSGPALHDVAAER